MANQIRTKDELLVLFADNTTHDISPQDLRDFVLSNNVQQTQVESIPATINEDTDFFIADVGCISVTLPLINQFGDRTLTIINANGGNLTVNSAPFETINGVAFEVIADAQFALIGAESASVDWLVLINTTATLQFPDQYALAAIQDSVLLTPILDGVFGPINDNLVGFTASLGMQINPGNIEFIGANPKLFSIDAVLSGMKSGGASGEYDFSIAVNDVDVGIKITHVLDNTTHRSVTLNHFALLNPNDTVKVVIAGNGTSDDVTILDHTLRLTEIKT